MQVSGWARQEGYVSHKGKLVQASCMGALLTAGQACLQAKHSEMLSHPHGHSQIEHEREQRYLQVKIAYKQIVASSLDRQSW